MSSHSNAVTVEWIPPKPKDKRMLPIFEHYLKALAVDLTKSVLVVGGGEEDLAILSAVGFQSVVLSNLKSCELCLDAEDMKLPDNSYSAVFAHGVLHHCRCPHKALGEMVRVARQHVFFLDANDSWVFRLLTRLKLSFPYEVGITVDRGYLEGGMRNGSIPNYMYRWTEGEVRKCVAAYNPERKIEVHALTYWDFEAWDEESPLRRRESRTAKLAQTIGPRNFVRGLRTTQAVLNAVPPLRAEGNKFFCAISKGELQPWIEARNGQFYEKAGYRTKLSAPL